MKIQNTFSGAFMKAKGLSLCTFLTLAASGSLHAQTTSYSANSTPVNGANNTAFGQGALSSNTSSGIYNTATGINTLGFNTTGSHNTATGFHALGSNTTGSVNTATGTNALVSNTTGNNNTATGYGTLFHNSTGIYNTASGSDALYKNTSGHKNTATGAFSLNANTTGGFNTATGGGALAKNTTGSYNTATGAEALSSNTTGTYNVANGYEALYSNTTGKYNAATGYQALYANTNGYNNVAMGYNALRTNNAGYSNTAAGYEALYANANGYNNVAMGRNAMRSNTSGRDNTAIGYNALSTNTEGLRNTCLGSRSNVSTIDLINATAIGYGAIVNADDKIWLGNTSIGVIESTIGVLQSSDGRFKSNIKEEDVKGLEFIQKLRPVVYNFDTKKLTEFLTKNMPDSVRKTYLNQDFSASTAIRQSGFIAQEVEQAAKDVNYDFNGVHVPENDNDNYSLAYAQFVVPLVKAVQEQQKMIAALQQQVDELQQGKSGATGIRNDGLSIMGASMDQNIPNPFSRETIIPFNLPQQITEAYMTVYDLSGREIKTLPVRERGASSITLTADQLEAGMYIYSIVADGKMVDSKRMVVAGK